MKPAAKGKAPHDASAVRVAAVIRMLRITRRLEAKQFAHLLGASHATLRCYDAGKRHYPLGQLFRAAEALNVPAWLILKLAHDTDPLGAVERHRAAPTAAAEASPPTPALPGSPPPPPERPLSSPPAPHRPAG